jgi:hypothetical protein
MFLGDREPDHRHHTLRAIRDVVEVVAIIAAGCWAFYIFVYENRIKPSFADPHITFSATMQKVSQHGGLTAIRLKTEATNVSTVSGYFYGYAITVLGSRVTAQPNPTTPPPPTASDTDEALRPFNRLSKPVAVFGSAFITHLGNRTSQQGLDLAPGETNQREWIFYVPTHRFDVVDAFISARYSKDGDTVIPTRLVRRESRPTFVSNALTSGVSNFDVDFLDLNGP